MKEQVNNQNIITPGMMSCSDFKKTRSTLPKSFSAQKIKINSPKPATSPDKQRLKLYGALKLNRYEIGEGEDMTKSKFQLAGYTPNTSKKWIYYSDKDNGWNNPKWCKSEKLQEQYHHDKLRRDCASIDKLMIKTIKEEKQLYVNQKGQIDGSKEGRVVRQSDRIKERVIFKK